MITLQKIDNIAVIFMTILGIIFFIISSMVFKNLNNDCSSKTLKSSWIIIQVIGACMTTLGISFFVCTLGSGANCYKDISNSRSVEFYFAIFGALSLIMTGVSALILSKYNKLNSSDQDICDPKGNMKNLATFVVVISSLVVVACIVFFIKIHMEADKIVKSEI